MEFPAPPAGLKANSEILSKVQAFLPIIEKANKELEEKIARDGQDSVRIDKTLDTDSSGGTGGGGLSNSSSVEGSKTKGKKPLIVEVGAATGDAKGTEQEEEEQEEEEEQGEHIDAGGGGKERQIQLEFALGDFDDTPIAQAERAAEAEARDQSAPVARKGKSEVIWKAKDEDEED